MADGRRRIIARCRPALSALLLSLLAVPARCCNTDQQPASPAASQRADDGDGDGDRELCRPEVRSVVQRCGSAHLEYGLTVAALECQAELEHEHGGRWQVAVSRCGFAYRVRHSSQLCLVPVAIGGGGDVHVLAWAD